MSGEDRIARVARALCVVSRAFRTYMRSLD